MTHFINLGQSCLTCEAHHLKHWPIITSWNPNWKKKLGNLFLINQQLKVQEEKKS